MNSTENTIANNIREAINDSVNGRSGKNVYGQDVNTVHHRIINVRVKNGKVEGRSLSSGKWFLLAGWDAR
jgi:hypothetical protein